MSNQNTVIALGYAQAEVTKSYEREIDHEIVGWNVADIVSARRNKAVEIRDIFSDKVWAQNMGDTLSFICA